VLLSTLSTIFPLPLGSIASTAIIVFLFLPMSYYSFNAETRTREPGFNKIYSMAILSLLAIPLQILIVAAFIIFFKDVGDALQALLGFIYPLITMLFRWLGGRITKVPLYIFFYVESNPVIVRQQRSQRTSCASIGNFGSCILSSVLSTFHHWMGRVYHTAVSSNYHDLRIWIEVPSNHSISICSNTLLQIFKLLVYILWK
jgi:hypothetical protein